MLGVAATGHHIDPVVGSARLAWIQPGRRVGDARHLTPGTSHGVAGAPLSGEVGPHVVQHRVLHRHLQPPALSGLAPLVQSAEDGDRHQHAGAGVADGYAGLHRLAAGLASHAHCAAAGLRDHVEGEIGLERAALAEAFHLAVDDAGV